MKTKKFLSLLLALAMVFAMSVSAFADVTGARASLTSGDGLGNTDFTATATVKVPAIEVVVPKTNGALFINPMGFTLKVADGANATATEKAAADADDADPEDVAAISNEKVISPTYIIRNLSPMDLDVTVNPQATVAAGATALAVASTADIAASTKNEVFIYAQFDAIATAVDDEDIEATDGYYPSVTKADYPTAADAVVPEKLLAIPSKLAKEGTKVGTIVAGTDDASGVMTMKFFGTVAGAPKNDWKSDETLTVTMAFTFKPHVDAPVGSAG